jgi:hypothetical protein
MTVCVLTMLRHTGTVVMTPLRPLRPAITSMLVPASFRILPGKRLLTAVG